MVLTMGTQDAYISNETYVANKDPDGANFLAMCDPSGGVIHFGCPLL